MKTYTEGIKGEIFMYFWDPSIKSWTILQIDRAGNQIGEADYCANKQSLMANYPLFSFDKFKAPKVYTDAELLAMREEGEMVFSDPNMNHIDNAEIIITRCDLKTDWLYIVTKKDVILGTRNTFADAMTMIGL